MKEQDLINYGKKLRSLKKYKKALEFYDKALKINPYNKFAWFYKGLIFFDLQLYKNAIECYDEVLRIIDDSGAWYNKGLACLNLNKNKEALDCFNAVLRIDSKNKDAIECRIVTFYLLKEFDEVVKYYPDKIDFNYKNEQILGIIGLSLVELKRYENAIKFFETILKINPANERFLYEKAFCLVELKRYEDSIQVFNKLIEFKSDTRLDVYINKSISLFFLRKFSESLLTLEHALEIAKKTFSREKLKKIRFLIKIISNTKEIIERLNKIDNEFIDCLNSDSLMELKQKSFGIVKKIRKIKNDFKKRYLFKDAMILLESKIVCISSIYKTIDFKRIDKGKLIKAKEIFKKWENSFLVWAVDGLVYFNNLFSEFNNIDEIQQNYERYLLKVLKSFAYVLDGELTIQSYKNYYINVPEIEYITQKIEYSNILKIKIPLIETIKDNKSIRVCMVTLDFDLEPMRNKKGFGFIIKKNEQENNKIKILKALKIAGESNANFVIFPELSFLKIWIDEIIAKYKDIVRKLIIICGSYYIDSFNRCELIIFGKRYIYNKNTPSPFEMATFRSDDIKMQKGKELLIFEMEDTFAFSILTCIDYKNKSEELIKNTNTQIIIFNPCFDSNITRFQDVCNINSRENDVVTVQVNRAASKKEYGKTCIVALEHKIWLKKLLERKIKFNDDVKYKLCNFDEESIAIIDIYLNPPRVPIDVNYKGRIDIIAVYNYKNGEWKIK